MIERKCKAQLPSGPQGCRPFCPGKTLLFNIQVDLQIAFSMKPFHRGSGLSTFSSGPRIHLQMKLREVQPCPTERQDAFPLFPAWERRDGQHSLALLISGDSKQILFNSGIISLNVSLRRTSDNTKLP